MPTILAGVKPLQQFMDDGSFLMPEIPAVLRALQAMHAPDYVDYDYLLSISGMAVRLAWQQGWAEYEGLPNQAIFYHTGNMDIAEIALKRAGAGYTTKRISQVGVETARRDIQASIDRGVPVLFNGGPHVYTTILGYGDGQLYGVATFADASKRIQPHAYNLVDDWQNTIQAYILIDQYTPKEVDKELFMDTLRAAVYHARTHHIAKWGDTALGTSAFDALAEAMVWDEGFEPLQVAQRYEGAISFPYDRPAGYYRTDGARTLGQRFWAGYCDFLCMLNGYGNFARFLEKYTGVLPEHRERIQQAASYYSHACSYSGELWNYVTPDDAGVAKFKQKDVRYAFAAHMLRAKIYTIKAVERLEGIIG